VRAGRYRRHHHRGPRLWQAGLWFRILRGPRPERPAGHAHHQDAAPVIVAQRLRKGSCGSPRGAKRLVADVGHGQELRSGPAGAKILLRADSAFYGRGPVLAAVRAGAQVSVTVRLNAKVKAAISAIPEDAWQAIDYTDAVFDQNTSAGSQPRRSPRFRSPRSPHRRRSTRSPGASSCAGSPTSTSTPGRRACSRPGASTRSSPPAPWTPWPLTRSTAVTRLSNKFTPT